MSDPPASGPPRFRVVPAGRGLGEMRPPTSMPSAIQHAMASTTPQNIDYASIQPPPLREPHPQHQPPMHGVSSPMIRQDNGAGPQQMQIGSQPNMHQPPQQFHQQARPIGAPQQPQHQGQPMGVPQQSPQHQGQPMGVPQQPPHQQGQPMGAPQQPPQQHVDPVTKSVKLFQTLLRNKPDNVRPRLIGYVTDVIHGTIEPEEFTNRLEEVLGSKAQSHLLAFLHETLPVLRKAIENKEIIYQVEQNGDQAVIDFAKNFTIQQMMGTPATSQQQPQNRLPMGNQQQMQQNQTPVSIRSGASGPLMGLKNEIMEMDDLPNVSELRREIQQVTHKEEPNVQQIVQAPPSEEETVRQYKESPFANTLIQPAQIMTKITQRMNMACYVDEELVTLISDATEYRIRELIGELGVMAQHRLDPNPKANPDYFVLDDAKSQIKWLEAMDRQLEEQRLNREKEEALRMGKGKGSSTKDSIERAKEMQRADAEAKRTREANAAAIAALSGSKAKTNRWDAAGAGAAAHQTLRSRAIRVNMRDFHTVYAANPRNRRSTLLHKLALATPPTDLTL
ncbi:unnamed protein product, partial [Mesorhabditis belari]|uniref:TAFH domain-containing protein n=1 Tax=Mesorhabditis belari TaxID=2138241 RepID=A0AAF3EIS1_9BILA